MSRVALLLLPIGLIAGCFSAAPDSDPSTSPSLLPPAGATHVLVGASEPSELLAPTFKLLPTVATGAAVIGGGEPSIWAHLDDTLYLAFPGCDKGGTSAPASFAGCTHGPVYRSTDDGETWKRLNRESDGRLSGDGPAANGDNEVSVDAAGVVYASDLGAGGIQVFRSKDAGGSWEYMGNATPRRTGADRQWMAAASPGHLIVTYMQTTPNRSVAINTTWDGGETWGGFTTLDYPIGWLGPVQFAPDGIGAYIPYTRFTGDNTAGAGLILDGSPMPLKVARTLDGGHSWESLDTGIKVPRSRTGAHWSGTLMAPALDVTGDGHVVLVWAEDVTDPAGGTSSGSRVMLAASADQGATWSKPVRVSQQLEFNAIMPWVTGGAGDRVGIHYYSSPVPLDSDYVGKWDVVAVVVDGVGSEQPRMVRTTVAPNVHVGGLCARGGTCLLTASDRSLLDFMESDLLPDGRLVLTYVSDPPTGAKAVEIHAAIQTGGTPLLLRD